MLDLTPVRPALQKLQAVEAELSSVLIEPEEAFRAAIMALLTCQHLALISKSGSEKRFATTEELDYSEVLDWSGLRFAASGGQQPAAAWKLEIREDATEANKNHLRGWVGQTGK